MLERDEVGEETGLLAKNHEDRIENEDIGFWWKDDFSEKKSLLVCHTAHDVQKGVYPRF